MITFDPSHTLLFNIGINTYSCIITIIILYSYKRSFADTYDVRLIRKIEITVILILLTDIGMWVLNGKSGHFIHVVSIADNILYFILQIALALAWVRYAYYRIFGQDMSRMKKNILIFIPFILLSLIVITSPLNEWLFYLDDANYYHRGVLSTPMFVLILALLLSATVTALVQYKKAVFIDRKKELLTIAFFAAPPILGGVAQTVFYGISMVWPCVVISSLLVLLDKQSQAILQDPLTGLNNRRNIERYLRTNKEGLNRAITLFMLDINDFKRINDEYGHKLGDTALIQTANILREIFSDTTAFLARYGGDEFMIIMRQGEESTAEKTAQKIRNSFDAFGRTKQFPLQLSVSIGYTISTGKDDEIIADLLKEADANMYRDKASYHK